MRSCRSCSETKPNPEFRGRRPDCRACERAACREYGRANRPRRNARLSRWRKENPQKAKAADRRKALKKNYGLTEADVVAMSIDQGGYCSLCGEMRVLVVDHCHKTGRVRGLLCHRCNTALGWLEAHPTIWSRLSQYLDQPCHADVLLELANEPAEVPFQ